jgi:hypothetical protein
VFYTIFLGGKFTSEKLSLVECVGWLYFCGLKKNIEGVMEKIMESFWEKNGIVGIIIKTFE